MTNRELFEKYDCLLLAKGIVLDAEADPELESFLKEFQEEYRLNRPQATLTAFANYTMNCGSRQNGG